MEGELRAGIESTVSEFVNGHGMRQARYRSRAKTHVQHVLTAIAVNIERVHAEQTTPTAERPPRTPTALQSFLDRQGIPRPTAGRTAGTS
ncbi:transposase [Streptomyces sp. NPDC048278]|uniref:transposase n=1 Tax=Streptomyces sp. NPDC048278 TaxID=3155809 RepID=UPI003436B953